MMNKTMSVQKICSYS